MQLKPLVAVPTTFGTGSETSGICIFNYEPLKTKIGIINRLISYNIAIKLLFYDYLHIIIYLFFNLCFLSY